MNNKFLRALTMPWETIAWLNKYKIGHVISDKMMLECLYRTRLGVGLNLTNPRGFNEKLQWLKLYDRNPRYIDMTDKVLVKDMVGERIGYEYVVPTLGIWAGYDDIDFESLPEKFVLKCNHDSGGVVIVKNKSDINHKLARKKIEDSLKRNFFWLGREWPYKSIVPKVFAEEYLEEEGAIDITDYKMMCFNGKCKCIFTCTERHLESGLKVTFFDTSWKELPFERHFPKSEVPIPKPDNLEELIKIAETLAMDIPFVRIDLYDVKGKILFGEYTFYPGCGFEEFNPKKWDEILGSWICL